MFIQYLITPFIVSVNEFLELLITVSVHEISKLGWPSISCQFYLSYKWRPFVSPKAAVEENVPE